MPARRSPLRELFLSRTRQFFREPETIFWVYVFPLVLMTVLGGAFGSEAQREYRVRVLAASESERESLARALGDGSEELDVVTAPLEDLEDTSTLHEYDLNVVRRDDGVVEYRFDARRTESVLAHAVVERVLQDGAGREDPVPDTIVPLDVPGSRYVDWLLPGLIGMNIMGGGLYGVGFVAVDLRIRKLLKRFRATPMRKSDFLLSLIGCRLVFLVPEVVSILLVGYIAFGVTVGGSFGSVLLVAFVGASAFSGLGLLVASRARKLETISGLMNLVMMPMWLVSGVFFPSERFPDAVQPLIQALPLTQLIHAMRGVVLRGEGLIEIAPHLGVLLLWGAICFPLSLRLFRWQ